MHSRSELLVPEFTTQVQALAHSPCLSRLELTASDLNVTGDFIGKFVGLRELHFRMLSSTAVIPEFLARMTQVTRLSVEEEYDAHNCMHKLYLCVCDIAATIAGVKELDITSPNPAARSSLYMTRSSTLQLGLQGKTALETLRLNGLYKRNRTAIESVDWATQGRCAQFNSYMCNSRNFLIAEALFIYVCAISVPHSLCCEGTVIHTVVHSP
jgi:hypothetical protein